jgi:hypothetical protein
MDIKVKYAMPVLQVFLASGLLRWSYIWTRAAERICDMPGSDPAWKLLLSVNAPVFLARGICHSLAPSHSGFDPLVAFLVDDVLLVGAVGLFWYWVALNLYSWRSRRMVFMFRAVPMRMAGDALLTSAGVLLGYWSMVEARQIGPVPHGMGCFGSLAWFWWLPSVIMVGTTLAWSLILGLLFARDFLYCLLRKTTALERSTQI